MCQQDTGSAGDPRAAHTTPFDSFDLEWATRDQDERLRHIKHALQSAVFTPIPLDASYLPDQAGLLARMYETSARDYYAFAQGIREGANLVVTGRAGVDQQRAAHERLADNCVAEAAKLYDYAQRHRDELYTYKPDTDRPIDSIEAGDRFVWLDGTEREVVLLNDHYVRFADGCNFPLRRFREDLRFDNVRRVRLDQESPMQGDPGDENDAVDGRTLVNILVDKTHRLRELTEDGVKQAKVTGLVEDLQSLLGTVEKGYRLDNSRFTMLQPGEVELEVSADALQEVASEVFAEGGESLAKRLDEATTRAKTSLQRTITALAEEIEATGSSDTTLSLKLARLIDELVKLERGL